MPSESLINNNSEHKAAGILSQGERFTLRLVYAEVGRRIAISQMVILYKLVHFQPGKQRSDLPTLISLIADYSGCYTNRGTTTLRPETKTISLYNPRVNTVSHHLTATSLRSNTDCAGSPSMSDNKTHN